jgi:hypothetical protein
VALSLVEMKCAILLNQSTTTMIASNLLDGGKFTIKSMETLSHDPLRVGNNHKNPTCFLLIKCSILLANQDNFHVFFYIVFQSRPIISLLEECYGALCTTMACKGAIMTLLQEHIPKPPSQKMKLILLIPQPISQIEL